MDKDQLQKEIESGLSFNKIAKKYQCSLTKIRYWAKKYCLESKFESLKVKEGQVKEYGESRFCPRCKEDLKIQDFYSRRGKGFSSGYCKKCTGLVSHQAIKKFKKECLAYRGGKCINCGYNKCISALDFHHRDPSEKEFSISSIKRKKLTEQIKKELDKCDILCSNCHRELHETRDLLG